MATILFSKSHEWVSTDGNAAKIGISDYAQNELGDIVYVGLPEVGAAIRKGDVLCDVESVKAVSEIYAPVSGKIVAVNTELEEVPELINTDAMGAWICEVELDGAPEDLMTEEVYKEFIKG